jgi:acyl carrier protein
MNITHADHDDAVTARPDRTETVVLRAVADQIGTTVTRDSRLQALDIDSLDVLEVVQRINEELGVALDPFELRGAVTIGDLIDAPSKG